MGDEMHNEMTSLNALIDLVEQAEGPDRVLDTLIHDACDMPALGQLGHSPLYTASLDAALTMVPEKAWWCVQALRDGRYQAAVDFLNIVGPRLNEAFQHSPALALCVAALRARAATKGD